MEDLHQVVGGYSTIQHHVDVGLVVVEPVVSKAWAAWEAVCLAAWAVVVWVDLISQANGILTSLLVRYLQWAVA